LVLVVSLTRTQVEPKAEDCVYEDIGQGDNVDARIMVYRGGKLDIKLRVRKGSKIFPQAHGAGLEHSRRKYRWNEDTTALLR
jgi:hypothetical protein